MARPKREKLSFARCTRLFSERGLTLTKCEGARDPREASFEVRNVSGRAVGSVQALLRDDKLKVGWIDLDPEYRGGGAGTLLYEAVVDHACAVGLPVVSDDFRSPFAEAFWRKQHRKRRVRCIKNNPKEDLFGGEYTAPMRRLNNSLHNGEITPAEYEAIVAKLPVSNGGVWPCYQYEIKSPCKTRSLQGVRRKRVARGPSAR